MMVCFARVYDARFDAHRQGVRPTHHITVSLSCHDRVTVFLAGYCTWNREHAGIPAQGGAAHTEQWHPVAQQIEAIRLAITAGLPSQAEVGFICGQLYQLRQLTQLMEGELYARRHDAELAGSMQAGHDHAEYHVRLDQVPADQLSEAGSGSTELLQQQQQAWQQTEHAEHGPGRGGARGSPTDDGSDAASVRGPVEPRRVDLRTVDIHRLKIPALSRKLEAAAKNSMFKLNLLLDSLPPLYEVAWGLRQARGERGVATAQHRHEVCRRR